MFTFKNKHQSIFEIYQSGIALFARSFKSVWHWALIMGLLNTLITQLYAYHIHDHFSYKGMTSLNLLYMVNVNYKDSIIIGLISLIVLVPILSFLAGIMIYQIYLIGSESKKSLKDTISIVINKLPLLTAAYLIVGIITYLGMMFLFPGIFFAIMLVFVPPLILLDDHSFVDAFKYTWLLVWKSWWRTFAVLLPTMIVFVIKLPNIYTGIPSLGYIIFDLLRTTIVTPLFYSLMLAMFYDSKLRHHVALHLPRHRKGNSD